MEVGRWKGIEASALGFAFAFDFVGRLVEVASDKHQRPVVPLILIWTDEDSDQRTKRKWNVIPFDCLWDYLPRVELDG